MLSICVFTSSPFNRFIRLCHLLAVGDTLTRTIVESIRANKQYFAEIKRWKERQSF